MANITERMIGAAMLNVSTYEEVEADQSATTQAMTVVVLASLANGIAGFSLGGVKGLILGTLSALIGWVIWSGTAFLIGTKILPEPQTRSDIGELLRTTGFAQSAGILKVFGILPLIGGLIVLIASLWTLVAMVIAVRQALDYQSTGRAVGVCLIGFVLFMILGLFVGGMIGAAGVMS